MQTEEQNLQDAINAQNNASYQHSVMPESADPAKVQDAEAEAAAPAAPHEQAAGTEEQAPEVLDADALAAENAVLRAKLDEAGRQAADQRDQMMRVMAEAQNIRKRAEADVERERKFAVEKFVKAIIPVYDSLDQALALSNREDPAAKATLEGVENTIKLLLKELGNMGIECINPQGAAFDPNVHQAISMAPSPEVPNNHVLAVMQKGFILNGRVVRPAMVIVSKGVPAETKPAEEQSAGPRVINIEA